MLENGQAPFTHGMEVEQFPEALPAEVRNVVMDNHSGGLDGWHDDLSGPRETTIGAFKNAKTILNRFYEGTRGMGVTWDWHAAHRRDGAGSHVHLCLERDVFDDHIAGWTVAYNSVIETFPFFAPYFCHDWQNGFREGTGEITHWARQNLTRYSQDSVQERVNNPTNTVRDNSISVTFNPAQRSSGKPLTIELRANDAHPAMALPGLLQLRRLTGRAIEVGWSPKLANRRDTLDQVYDKIYNRATRVGLLTAMQEPIDGGIKFLDGRGLPHVDKMEFETPFEVLRKIQIAQPETPNTWTCRPYNLVRAGKDEFSPARNQDQLWNMDGASGSFNWTNGPQDATSEVR